MSFSPKNPDDGRFCPNCKLVHRLCYCRELPLLDLKTRFSFLVHFKETYKSSNTSLPLYRALANSDLILRGRGFNEDPSLVLQKGYTALYLFPENNAVPLKKIDPAKGPYQVVVPDGSWRQARRTKRRFPVLQETPAVILPPVKNPLYTLRKSKNPEGMCTLEAVASVIKFLESEEEGRLLEKLLRILVARVEESRGLKK